MNPEDQFQLSFEDVKPAPAKPAAAAVEPEAESAPEEERPASVCPDDRLFQRLPLRRRRAREILRLTGDTRSRTVLIIGGDAMTQEVLRSQPGIWETASWLEQPELLFDEAETQPPAGIPYEDAQFDIVVAIDVLQFLSKPDVFIRDCHRVLKSTGLLILQMPHLKSWSLLPLLKRLLDLRDDEGRIGQVRRGYRAREVFDLLKDGFDVDVSHAFSRFFSEATDVLVRYAAGYVLTGDPDSEEFRQKACRYFGCTMPLYWLAAALDCLLFMTRGYTLVTRGRRRIWRPRRSVVLLDGRTLAEAALTAKIGTAAEK